MSEGGKPKESKLKPLKRESRRVRGTIGKALAEDTTHFTKDENEFQKFQGIDLQDSRDQRHGRRPTASVTGKENPAIELIQLGEGI